MLSRILKKLILLIVLIFIIFLYIKQDIIKLSWCDNCFTTGSVMVVKNQCIGLKIQDFVLFKFCRSFSNSAGQLIF